MKTQNRIFQSISIFLFAFGLSLASCEGPVGPAGDIGPQGKQGLPGAPGEQGPTGNANIQVYKFSPKLNSFVRNFDHEVWGVPVLKDNINRDVSIADDDLVSVFVWEDVWSEIPEWVALPFNHYYSSSDIYNHHSFSVNPEYKRLWLYIRNSAGITPYNGMTTSNSKLHYTIFVASADGLIGCDVDFTNYESIMDCLGKEDF